VLRRWDYDKPLIAWIGLNPSTADENRLDPTLRRVVKFSMDWGFGGFVMLNIFALRSAYPKVLRQVDDPVGPKNDSTICCWARKAQTVVAAWGADGNLFRRADHVSQLLKVLGVEPRCLGRTGAGQPRHPLYIKSTTPLEPYPC
jgi:hypothetical protein